MSAAAPPKGNVSLGDAEMQGGRGRPGSAGKGRSRTCLAPWAQCAEPLYAVVMLALPWARSTVGFLC